MNKNRTNRIHSKRTACKISHKGKKAGAGPASIKMLAITVAGILLFYSCGPVNRFTRIKKIPREYSMNYCGGEAIKAPKTDINKEAWIVYSDREKNASYNTPGGRVKAKDVDYLDPFLVIGAKGGYLKLVKYTPGILRNGKLDYKKAEYYGWMPKSRLLLNCRSETDISSGRRNKSVIAFSDTLPLSGAEACIARDSVKLYKGVEAESMAGHAAPYSIVYRMKRDGREGKTLIAKKAQIKPEDVRQDILGWIDNSLLADIGQGLHVNMPGVALTGEVQAAQGKGGAVALTGGMWDKSRFLGGQYPAARYTPVASYSVRNGLTAYRMRLLMPVFDNSDNYIINVNGGHISYRQFRDIAESLGRINIIFVLEGKEHTIARFPQVVNAIQNMQPLFEQADGSHTYRFGCVMAIDDSNRQQLHPVTMPLAPDYSALVNFLAGKANNRDRLRPLRLARPWGGIYKAMDMLDKYSGESNLVVVIGEAGYAAEEVDPALADRLAANNCRLLGFQVYAGDDNASNNFVLDMETMIDSYANAMKKTKGDILVSPGQVRQAGSYTELGDTKNGYRLDFPDNSITQGAILFPQKGEYLPLDILTANLDTLVRQVKEDNAGVIRHMSRAFNSVGNNRTRFDRQFALYFGLDTLRTPSRELVSAFRNGFPAWSMPTGPVLLTDSLNGLVDYRLMLSGSEMEELKGFVEALSQREVDYITPAEASKPGKKEPCNCEEDLFDVMADSGGEASTHGNGSLTQPAGRYAGTSGVRKYLAGLYLNTVKYCRLCQQKGHILRSMTLAEAQRRITGCPTATPLLNQIRIRDLSDENAVSDKMLDELVQYFKGRRDGLDKAEKFESNGQTYYWVDRKLLP